MSKKFALVWRVLGGVLIGIPLVAAACLYTNYALFFSLYLGIVCLLLPWVASLVKRKSERVYRVARGVFLSLFFAAVAYFGVVSTLMGMAIASADPAPGYDVVILGSGVRGDRPCTMLQKRLERTLDYLETDPEARVICCGGLTPGNPYSEAEVMKRYLTAGGIDESRILLDEQSTSTEENLRYAVRVMGETSRPIAVCSSDFHLYRAREFAEKAGMGEVALMAAPTPAPIFPAFWIREVFGLSRMWLLGY